MLGSFVCIGLKSTSRKRTLGDIEEIHGLRVENLKTIDDLKIEFGENDDLATRVGKLKTFCGFLKAGDLIVGYDIEVSLALLFRDLNLCIKRGPYFSTVAYISLYDALQDFYKANKKEEEQNFDDFIEYFKIDMPAIKEASSSPNAILDTMLELDDYGFKLENYVKNFADKGLEIVTTMNKSYRVSKELFPKIKEDLKRNGILEEVTYIPEKPTKKETKVEKPSASIQTEKQPSFTFDEHGEKDLFSYLNKFTVIDIECSGVGQADGEIIEIAAIKYKGNLPVETFQIMIEPDNPVKPESFKTHQISDLMLRGCVKIGTAIRKLASFLDDDNIIIGSNVKTADLRLLHRDSVKCGFPDLFKNVRYIDIVDVAKALHPEFENRRLGTLVEKLGVVPKGDMHRALCDCYAEAEVFLILKKEATQTGNSHALILRKF